MQTSDRRFIAVLKRITIIASLAALLTPTVALADGPVSLGIFPPVQIVKETESVTAFRLSLIYGKNVDMQGLDIGLVTRNTGDVTGLQWTAFGMVDGDFTGWQNGWLASMAGGNMQGLQSGFYNSCGLGSSGVQFGILNMADDFSGLQLGLVNVAETMRSGLQIGLINIIQNKEKLKFFPIVNWRF